MGGATVTNLALNQAATQASPYARSVHEQRGAGVVAVDLGTTAVVSSVEGATVVRVNVPRQGQLRRRLLRNEAFSL